MLNYFFCILLRIVYASSPTNKNLRVMNGYGAPEVESDDVSYSADIFSAGVIFMQHVSIYISFIVYA